MNTIQHNRQPGDAEAAAAIAGMAETYGRKWRPGDRVRCELPFYGDQTTGIVIGLAGRYVLVDVDGEELAYRPDQLTHLEATA